MEIRRLIVVLSAILLLAGLPVRGAEKVQTDGEVWNEGVDAYRAGDVTNALRVLRPLLLSKTHGSRAAEVVAKLEFESGNLEEAAVSAQIALRSAPDDAKANRNFTRATDRLPALREQAHVESVMKAVQGRDPGSLLLSATKDCRRLMAEAATYRTNRAERAVALSDRLAKRAETLADVWLPVRQFISEAVTNEEQAATISAQIDASRGKTRDAAKRLSDLDVEAYPLVADVENDLTRFLKLTAMPPAAMDEDLEAQSNAWLDVEAFNGRAWQQDALDYTRAFRAKFPAWARACEQQAQSDTNRPPFTAEDQAKISALATELEKLQLECVEKSLPPNQEEALRLIGEIRELLPKDPNSSQNQPQNQQQDKKDDQQQQQDQKKDPQQQPPRQDQQQSEEQQDPNDQDKDKSEDESESEESEEDEEVESVLKRAQERSDEHEAEKKARMRKIPLPPNERDW